MFFKPSPRTITLFKRGNWLFFPLWLGGLAYIWLRSEGVLPSDWDRFFFFIFGIALMVNIVYGLLALSSARQDAKKSQHPNADVAALIDGEIDIAEYGRRKSEVSASESIAGSTEPASPQVARAKLPAAKSRLTTA